MLIDHRARAIRRQAVSFGYVEDHDERVRKHVVHGAPGAMSARLRVETAGIRRYAPSRNDPDGPPEWASSPEEEVSGDDRLAGIGLGDAVALSIGAFIENFRTGSFAAGFLPFQDLPPAPTTEADNVRWDLSPLERRARGERSTQDPRPDGGSVDLARVTGRVAIRSSRDRRS